MARATTQTTDSRPGRVTLSRETIIEAALTIGSAEGGSALTFSRLGKELGADPTAVYRHFRDKDELVIALTERMVEESVRRVEDIDPHVVGWRESLRATAEAIRSVYLSRPVIAVLAASRTSASAVETASVETMIRVLHEAGLPVLEAAEAYRALIDLTLAFTQCTAAFRLLPQEAQDQDARAWAVAYATLPEPDFPLLHESASRLSELNRNDDAVFDIALATFLDGVEMRVTRARTGN